MKPVYLITAVLFYNFFQLSGQNIEPCATMEALKMQKQLDPELQKSMKAIEGKAAEWLKNNRSSSNRSTVTIPVVVHVVYHEDDSANQNIHDSVIYSQIDVLNEAFRRQNADTSNTRSVFDTIAADVNVEFCLAQYDPEGNSTTGITRTSTTSTFDFFSGTNEDVKFDSTGGKNIWPADQYLNIWVCELLFFGSPGVLGYAQFPDGDSATDGVVINYLNFGRTYSTDAAPANLGRTCVHEVGHWLGLRHIWGDGACDSTDYVADTPNANAASNSDCDTTKNTCANEDGFWGAFDPPDMVENYMDYSEDACMNSFTIGQSDRMWSFLNTDRIGLLSSDKCEQESVTANQENIKGINNLLIYPNPVNSTMNFNLNGNLTGNGGMVIIYNGLGSIVRKSFVSENEGTISLQNLDKGIYFVKFQSSNNILIEKVIVH